jgi:hypothetical protein
MNKLLPCLALLTISSICMADGVNKPKKKRHKAAVVKQDTKPAAKPKLPSLLTSKYDLIAEPFVRPLRPLNEIPPLPAEVLVTTETRVYDFEEDKKPKWAWLLLGTAAIPFLIPHGHDDVIPVPPVGPAPQIAPQSVPPTAVPEGSTLLLLSIGFVCLGFSIRRRRNA